MTTNPHTLDSLKKEHPDYCLKEDTNGDLQCDCGVDEWNSAIEAAKPLYDKAVEKAHKRREGVDDGIKTIKEIRAFEDGRKQGVEDTLEAIRGLVNKNHD